MNKEIKLIMYKALRNKFEAEQFEALATLHIYFENPAGIGEHPQIIEEMAKQFEKLSSAEDRLVSLKTHFLEYIN